jgi:hypothetical protein
MAGIEMIRTISFLKPEVIHRHITVLTLDAPDVCGRPRKCKSFLVGLVM